MTQAFGEAFFIIYLLLLPIKWVTEALFLFTLRFFVPGVFIKNFKSVFWVVIIIWVASLLLVRLISIFYITNSVILRFLVFFTNLVALKLVSRAVPGFRVGWLGAVVGAILLQINSALLPKLLGILSGF